MTTLKGVAVGAGYFSQFHFDAWSRIDDVELTAICDVDHEAAIRASESHGIPNVYSDFVKMLETEQPDFVDIITRPDSHLRLTREAAKRGIAVICQKPLAPSYEEAKELVETAKSANIPLMVHENFRFQPWYREIRRMLDDQAIGSKLHSLSFCMRTGDGAGPDAYLARQPYFRKMPRFLIHETGVHFIDTFRFLGGEVADIQAVLRRLNPVINGEDAGVLTFQFESGAVGTWDANRCNESAAVDPRHTFGTLFVEADRGSIRLDNDGRLFVKPLGADEREHEYVHKRRGFAGDCVYFTQRHFIECLRDGTPFETSGPEYLKTLELVEQAYEKATRINVPATDSSTHAPSNDARTPSPNRRIIDLSQPVQNGMRGVDISTATTIADKGWNSTTLSLYSHCGTHMDAPKHFLGDEGATIDQQSLSTCHGPARVVDLTPVMPRELLTVERLQASVDTIQAGDRLLLRTDWSHRLGSNSYRDELPRISPELADWLVEKKVALIGVEAPSVADVNDLPEVTTVHQKLFRGGVVIVEGLVNLDQLQQPIVEFIALPLRITDGDGSPVRAIAIEEAIL
jgi:predicted dehydrogenase/kynurenine formamidase